MSANSRYTIAIHAALLLDDPGGDLVSSEWIGGSANTNPVVVRRILGDLIERGLVVGVTGARGGYRLARPAAKITLNDIYLATREGGPFGMHAQEPNPKCPVGSCIQGALAPIYLDAERAMGSVLRRMSLASLRKRMGR